MKKNRLFIQKNILRLLAGFIFFLLTSVAARAQEPQLADTTFACQADSALLDAGAGFMSYLWNTNDTTQTIWATENGRYDVICVREGGSVAEDTTFVFMQNAFINREDTIYTCYTYPVILCVEPDTMMYSWSSSDPDLVIEHDTSYCVEVIPELDTTTVYVSISDSNNVLTCVDSVQIWLYPRIRFDEVNQINKGCPGTCIGQLQVIVSGGTPPYDYYWPSTTPLQYDSIAFGLCEAEYVIEVSDQLCTRDTSLPVKVFDMPEVNIVRDPEDAVYIKNPVVDFSYENLSSDSIQIFNPVWNFGDSTYSQEEMPTKVFDRVDEYEVWLKYTTSDECLDSVNMNVEIQPVELLIPNFMSPNGDGYNDLFVIEQLENYIRGELLIFNRYGKKVYSNNDYQSDWDGGNLKEGVYFYVLRAEGYFGTDVFRGSLTIMR